MSVPARLRWRARRGTRELDRMLGLWLDERYAQADDEARSAFEALLECSDPDLWDWLIGHAVPAQPQLVAIVDEIRTRHRV